MTDTSRCAKTSKPLITSRRTDTEWIPAGQLVRPTFQKHFQIPITNTFGWNDWQGEGTAEDILTAFSTFTSIHYFVTPFHIIIHQIIIDWKGAGAFNDCHYWFSASFHGSLD